MYVVFDNFLINSIKSRNRLEPLFISVIYLEMDTKLKIILDFTPLNAVLIWIKLRLWT